jgi:hypothetical protein
MLVIIAGSRHFHDQKTLDQAVEASGFEITCVISGAAKGVDRLGENWAQTRGIGIRSFPADWKKHGRAAGPIRNKEMAEVGEALIALPCPCSRGTRGMIKLAKEHGLPVFIQEVDCNS